MSTATARRGTPPRLLRAVSVSAGIALLAASGLVVAPAAQADTPSSRLVASWYHKFLGRTADAQGSQYWEDQLARRSPEDVLRELTRTRESASYRVTRLYRAYLNREPDTGARYWVDGVQQGRFPLEWVQQNIIASPEHASMILNSSDASRHQWRGDPRYRERAILVQTYFDEIFDGQVTFQNNDLSYWIDPRRPQDALSTVREIWYDSDAVDARIEKNYLIHLSRYPKPGETAYWRGPERASDDEVRLLIASSPEYLRCVETCFERGS